MPPEYAIDGIFSTKSDVYSFGVLVIEIISGKKNRSFVHPDHSLNLLGHVSSCNKYLSYLSPGAHFFKMAKNVKNNNLGGHVSSVPLTRSVCAYTLP